ncbi:synaptosomal-associated protein 23-like [Paramacrobiotus metropolitanus]|uniref:synaptosomal-associated protein 23-like n=1 Tax=Paramacrobiotus metropolitanus TaxID=2943436 RepID=UPI0024459B94|nr:synaptosomal-associated protein 23-like [Paramacrobiotus metropolitanus]
MQNRYHTNDNPSTGSTHDPDDASDSSEHVVVPTRVTFTADPEVVVVQKKSWTALQRSLVMCHEMEVCGKITLEKLAEASTKFQHIDDFHSKMERDLMETAVHLDDMQKCCFGLCTNPWAKKTAPIARQALEETLDDMVAGRANNDQVTPTNQQPGAKEFPKLEPFMLIANDTVEKEMEGCLDKMDGYLDKLEDMSEDIGNRLNGERRVIDATTDAMDKNILRATLARKKALATLKAV